MPETPQEMNRPPVAAAFTLVELLITVAIVSVLVSVLVPVIRNAIESARVVAVKADLRTIGDALEEYARNHRMEYPPTRTYCNPDERAYCNHLPNELADAGLVPADPTSLGLYCNVPDPFSHGCSYRYLRPGWGLHNGGAVPKDVWVPDLLGCDPFDSHVSGRLYDNLSRPVDGEGQVIPSPVKWVLWSVGPGYDPQTTTWPFGPVPREYWYRGTGTTGIIPRIATSKGMVICGP